MKNFTKIIYIFICIAIFSTILIPNLALADHNGNSFLPKCPDTEGGVLIDCTFEDAMATVKHIIDWMLYKMTLYISVLALVWAGWLYITSAGNPGKRSEANKMMWSILKGVLIMFCAWLIVNTILTVLGYTGIQVLSK
jgi:hypothetical protein